MVAGGPRAEDHGVVDAGDTGEFGSDDDGRAEGFQEHVGEPRVVGAVGVGTDETEIAEPSADHQAGLFRPHDLPVDGGVGKSEPFGQRGQGVLDVRIPQHGREDLALLA